MELIRLRAALLPEEEPSEEELRAIEEAKREIEEGGGVDLEDLLRGLD